MEKKINKLENSHVEVIIDVDTETWKKAQDKAFNKLAENVTVDGFRKGKAPLNMVKSKVDQVKVMDDAINSLLPTLYKSIIEEDKIEVAAQPKVDVTKLSDTELQIKFTLVTPPEVKLGQYKGLTIGKTEAKVTDKEVEDAINATLASNATLIVKEGAAEKGDTVVMDFVGKVDGKAFDGGSAQNHELELGSGQFIPGFEDQLIGAKAGDKVVVKVKFPENYTPELKGKDAEFECDVHEVKAKKLPELNEEFVKEAKIEGVKTIEEYKANKKKELLENKKVQAKREYINKVIDTVANSSKVSLPDEIVESQVASRKEDLINRMKQSGLTLEQYLQFVGQKEEEFMAKLKEDAKKETVSYFVLQEIVKAEKISISDEDLEKEFANIASQYKMKVEDVKKALSNQLEEYKNNLKMQKVEELLYNENN